MKHDADKESGVDTRMAVELGIYRPTRNPLPFPPGYVPSEAEVMALTAEERAEWDDHVARHPELRTPATQVAH
jgi:hypothetical protein